MKLRQIIVLGIFLLLIAVISVAILSGANGKGPMQGGAGANSSLKYVKVRPILNDTVEVMISALGRVTSARNINLTAEVQGKLEEGGVPLKSGQNFQRGQLLFAINDSEQRLSLQSRKSQFLNLMASVLPDLRIDYKDNFKRWEDFFNQLDVLKKMPELPQTTSVNEKTFMASRNVLSEYYGIKADEQRLAKYNVYAPFDGSYTDVMVEVGTVVNSGTQIARIIQYNSLEVSIPVAVNEVQKISKGAVTRVYSENRGKSWEGKVMRVGSSVNQNTQSVDVFIKVNQENNQPLYEGMYVEAIINCGQVENAVEIARKALFSGNEVYVVEDSLLAIREVIIEKTNKETVIVKGLKNNEQLVVEPIIGGKENLKVIPVKE